MVRLAAGHPLSGLALLGLGFLLGLRHALDADHLAAVASLAAGSLGRRARALRVTAAWGIGHAGVLVLAAIASGLTGAALPPRGEAVAELAAGAVVVWLGLDVLRSAHRQGVRVGVHRHADGTRHAHAHAARPDHPHARRAVARSLAVGALHGLSGSAVVGLLAVSGLPILQCVAYALVFGAGTIAGMLTLSAALWVPFGRSAPHALRRARIAIGCAASLSGVWLAAGAGRDLLGI